MKSVSKVNYEDEHFMVVVHKDVGIQFVSSPLSTKSYREYWFKNNKIHRDNGPAQVWSDQHVWCRNGRRKKTKLVSNYSLT